MRKTNLTLNDRLYEILESLTDKTVKGDELSEYVDRANAAVKISQQIINNKNITLKAAIAAVDMEIISPEAKSTIKLLAND
jgi:hypothetical protein